MNTGENIKKIRKEKGLTQRELGELSGISQKQIGLYEQGKRNPKIETLEKIAKGLGVDKYDIIPLRPFSYKETLYSETYKIDIFIEKIQSLGYDIECSENENVKYYRIKSKDFKKFVSMSEDDVFELLQNIDYFLEFLIEKLLKSEKAKDLEVEDKSYTWF